MMKGVLLGLGNTQALVAWLEGGEWSWRHRIWGEPLAYTILLLGTWVAISRIGVANWSNSLHTETNYVLDKASEKDRFCCCLNT